MKLNILHLTLKKKWFDLIASGKKTAELREVKPYWTKRLTVNSQFKHFDVIHFRNGYKKDSPFMRVCCRNITIDEGSEKINYVIHLGEILEISNYD